MYVRDTFFVNKETEMPFKTRIDNSLLLQMEDDPEVTRAQMAEYFGTSESYLSQKIRRLRKTPAKPKSDLELYIRFAGYEIERYAAGQLSLVQLAQSPSFRFLASLGALSLLEVKLNEAVRERARMEDSHT